MEGPGRDVVWLSVRDDSSEADVTTRSVGIVGILPSVDKIIIVIQMKFVNP